VEVDAGLRGMRRKLEGFIEAEEAHESLIIWIEKRDWRSTKGGHERGIIKEGSKGT